MKEGVKEIIFALTPSMASDGLILFIEDRLKEYGLVFTKIAQGVPTGVSLENVDILSLSKAIQSKVEI
jgi:recombination protein RecR